MILPDQRFFPSLSPAALSKGFEDETVLKTPSQQSQVPTATVSKVLTRKMDMPSFGIETENLNVRKTGCDRKTGQHGSCISSSHPENVDRVDKDCRNSETLDDTSCSAFIYIKSHSLDCQGEESLLIGRNNDEDRSCDRERTKAVCKRGSGNYTASVPCSASEKSILTDRSFLDTQRKSSTLQYPKVRDDVVGSSSNTCDYGGWTNYRAVQNVFQKALQMWDPKIQYIDVTSPDHVVVGDRGAASSSMSSCDETASFHTACDNLSCSSLCTSLQNLSLGDGGHSDSNLSLLSSTRKDAGIASSVQTNYHSTVAHAHDRQITKHDALRSENATPKFPVSSNKYVKCSWNDANEKQSIFSKGIGDSAKCRLSEIINVESSKEDSIKHNQEKKLKGEQKSSLDSTTQIASSEKWWSVAQLGAKISDAFREPSLMTEDLLPEDFSSSLSSDSSLLTLDPTQSTSPLLEACTDCSVITEYLYNDAEEGISLVERRFPAAHSPCTSCHGSILNSFNASHTNGKIFNNTSISSRTSSRSTVGENETTLMYDWKDYESLDAEQEEEIRQLCITGNTSTKSVLAFEQRKKCNQLVGSIKSSNSLWNTSNESVPSEISICSSKSDTSRVSIPSGLQQLSNTAIQNALNEQNDDPGPVTDSTRKVYLRRLARLNKHPSLPRRGHTGKKKRNMMKQLSTFRLLNLHFACGTRLPTQ